MTQQSQNRRLSHKVTKQFSIIINYKQESCQPPRRKNRAKLRKNNIGVNTYWHGSKLYAIILAQAKWVLTSQKDNKKPIIWLSQIIGI